MLNFKNKFSIKIISLIIIGVFVFTSAVYPESNLRVPIANGKNNKISFAERFIKSSIKRVPENKLIAAREKIPSLLIIKTFEIQLKEETDLDVRRAIATALGIAYSELIKQGKLSPAALENKLKKETNPDIRQAIVIALGIVYPELIKQGKDISLIAFETQFKKETNRDLRRVIITALGSAYSELIKQGKLSPAALEDKLKKETNPYLRQAIVIALGIAYPELIKQGKDISLTALETWLNEEVDFDVCQAIATALGSAYSELIKQGKLSPAALEDKLKKETNLYLRQAIVIALGIAYPELIKQGKDISLIAFETQFKKETNRDVRLAIATALRSNYPELIKQGKDISLTALETWLNEEVDFDVCQAIATALGSAYSELIKQGKLSPAALEDKLKKETNLYLRQAIVIALGIAYSELIKQGKLSPAALEDKLKKEINSDIRQAIATILGSAYSELIKQGKLSPAALEDKFKKEINYDIRQAIVIALGIAYPELIKQGKDISLTALETWSNEEVGFDIRRAIATALGNAYPELIKQGKLSPAALEDKLKKEINSDIRQAIVIALGIAYPELIKDAVNSLKDLGINNENLLSDYLELSSLIINKDSKYLLTKYDQLKSHFEITNNNLQEERKIDQEEFFNSNESNIVLLLEITGEDTFNFLKKFLKNDPYPLKRFFEALDASNIDKDTLHLLKEFYSHNPKKDFDSFQKILEIISLYKQNGKITAFQNKLKESIKSNLSWGIVFDDLSLMALKNISESLGIVTGDIKSGILSRFIIRYIPRLKIAMDFITSRHHDKLAVFKALLKATFEDNYNDFITNKDQQDEIGREIALHNESVRKDIAKCGVDLKAWLDYNKEKPFSYSNRNSKIDPEDELIRSIGLIALLYKKLDVKHQAMLENTLKKIGLEIAKDESKMPLKPIDKNHGNIHDILKLFTVSGVMERLSKSIEFIKKKFSADVSIQENILHLSQSTDTLQQQISNPEALKELYKKKMNFTIRMWKRDPAHDLFLGDLTGCCMATNANQYFHAMIDHLIDQGIQVAEVIDQATGRTVALAWLFLAKDKDNNPYLVIDNIEVNDSYSDVTPLKEVIKNNLVEYCKEYAKTINCKALLAGLFTYSKVDVDEFPKEKIDLNKIGGYFGDEEYYLEALETEEVRVIEKYDIEKIEKKPRFLLNVVRMLFAKSILSSSI